MEISFSQERQKIANTDEWSFHHFRDEIWARTISTYEIIFFICLYIYCLSLLPRMQYLCGRDLVCLVSVCTWCIECLYDEIRGRGRSFCPRYKVKSTEYLYPPLLPGNYLFIFKSCCLSPSFSIEWQGERNYIHLRLAHRGMWLDRAKASIPILQMKKLRPERSRLCRLSGRVWTWTRVLSTDRKTSSKPTPTGFSAPSADQRFRERQEWRALHRGLSREWPLGGSSESSTEMEYSREWACCFSAPSEPVRSGQILLSLTDPLKQLQIKKQDALNNWLLLLKANCYQNESSFCYFHYI